MNDQPQVDNPPGVGLGLPGEKVKNPFLLDSKQPGPETGSTPVNLKNFAEQQTTANDPLIQTLMQEIKEKKPVVENKPKKKFKKIKSSNQQQGFLMPLVNGFNNFLEGITNALKSLIPMKPQTGTGST